MLCIGRIVNIPHGFIFLSLAGGNDSIGVRLCTALFKRAYGDFTQSVFTDSLPNSYFSREKSKIAYGT